MGAYAIVCCGLGNVTTLRKRGTEIMAENKNFRDDKLIRELYDKLNWFTFKATDEEFDPDQVNAILDLLDKLDPLPESPVSDQDRMGHSGSEAPKSDRKEGTDTVPMSNAEAAFERFKAKYNITEEDLARKNGGSAAETNAEGEGTVPFPAEFSKELAFDRVQAREIAEGIGGRAEARMDSALADRPVGKTRSGAAQAERASAPQRAKKTWFGRVFATGWGKVAVAFVVVIVVFAFTAVGTSAVKQKSFFEIVKSGVNSMRITVTGNEMESERESLESVERDEQYYDSWEDIREENPDILIPTYIPGGLSLKEIHRIEMENYVLYLGSYIDSDLSELLIRVEDFSSYYADMEQRVGGKWKLLKTSDKVDYYQLGERYKVLWQEGKCIYSVEWTDLNQIDEICSKMK